MFTCRLLYRRRISILLTSFMLVCIASSMLGIGSVQATVHKSAQPLISNPCDIIYGGGSGGNGTDGFALLAANECVVAGNSRTALDMQKDGNLVVYMIQQINVGVYSYTALWASHTAGKGASFVVLQSDGNFVMYNTSTPTRKAVWASRTDGNFGDRLEVQDDGNVVIYEASPYNTVHVWATGTVHS